MQVTIREFVKNFKVLIDQQVASNSMSIASGSIPDMEKYHRRVGQNEGLKAAVGLADDMLRQLEDAERDQDLPEMTDADKPTGKGRGNKK